MPPCQDSPPPLWQALFAVPTSAPMLVGKAVAIAVGALLLAAHALIVRPYTARQAWKGPVSGEDSLPI